MTARLIYRFLVRVHPRNFRELHGDEMLCIFDESAPTDTHRLVADALLSLARQWALHSGWWKLVAGAAVSSLLVLACGYSISGAFRWSMIWGVQHADLRVWYAEPPDASFNEWEFESEAQEAVRMLAGHQPEEAARRRNRANRP